MPALNSVDPDWDLDDLIRIHGLLTSPHPRWTIGGIAEDLGTTPEATVERLRAHGVPPHLLDT